MRLELHNVVAGYGQMPVLRKLTVSVGSGEVLCLMGRNGAGKTTALKAVMGLVETKAGEVLLDQTRLDTLPPHAIPRLGIGYVPQGRRLFSELTVRENLTIGLMTRGSGLNAMRRVLELFPRLGERLDQAAGSLSGGEQQMLAIGRALCLEPSVILLDEPTEGLQPSMVSLICEIVRTLKQEGLAIIMVEQRADVALSVSDRIGFVVNGTLVEEFRSGDLDPQHAAFARHVGV